MSENMWARSCQTRNFPKAMLITAGRIAYIGLLGRPSTRMFGAFAIYASMGAPFRVVQHGQITESRLEIIEPYTPHQVSSPDKYLYQVLVEADTVSAAWPLEKFHGRDERDFTHRLKSAFASLKRADCDEAEFDRMTFGVRLPQRTMDPRIAAVVREITLAPGEVHAAQRYAEMFDLSISRFVHLFRDETGTTMRRFRAWKRARSVMHQVTATESMVNIALDSGYADSTHFSHSIRQYFGLTPRDIFAGSRGLTLRYQA